MLRQYLKSLADKFRSYLGLEDDELIPAQNFTDAIEEVYEAGKQAGGSSDDRFEEGKKSEYDMFWDNFQDYGNRQHYNYGFASHMGWSETNFKPKYDIVPSQANYIFYGFRYPSLKPFIDDRGLKLDFSKCTNTTYAFLASKLTELGTIDISSAKTAITNTFNNCPNLVTIEKLIMSADNKGNMFNGCKALENLIIEGVIGQDFSVSDCTNLSRDSLMSIINHLETKTSGIFTLSLGATNIAKLTDPEKAIVTQEKKWTLA